VIIPTGLSTPLYSSCLLCRALLKRLSAQTAFGTLQCGSLMTNSATSESPDPPSLIKGILRHFPKLHDASRERPFKILGNSCSPQRGCHVSSHTGGKSFAQAVEKSSIPRKPSSIAHAPTSLHHLARPVQSPSRQCTNPRQSRRFYLPPRPTSQYWLSWTLARRLLAEHSHQ